MISSSFKAAVIDYEIEVDTVAAELVASGVAPWSAMERAGEIVRRRRQSKDRVDISKEAVKAK